MPTIIDTLIVRLGLDPKELDSRSTGATRKLKDVEKQSADTEKSVKKLGSAAKESASGVETLTRSLAGLFALIGGSMALRHFIEETIASNAELERFSKNIGLNVSDVSAWGNAVEEMGGNAKSLRGTMDMLSKAQTELRLTGQSSLIPYFSALGISLATVGGEAKPVDQILLQLAERFSRMDRTTANNMGRMMGIDQDTLNLLLRGRQEVELTIKRQKEYNAVTKEQAEQAVKLQRAQVQLRQSYEAIGRTLLQAAAPALEKLLSLFQTFGNWLQGNIEFVKDFGLVLGTIAAGLGAIAVASSPITLTVAAIVALAGAIALLWQDYQTWKRGGDSLIDWSKWENGIEAAKKGIRALREEIKGLTEAVGSWLKKQDEAFAAKHGGLRDKLGRFIFGDNWKPAGNAAPAAQATPGEVGNPQEMMKYFQQRGMSKAEAAGLVANIMAESSGRTNLTGDHGAAYGLLQWHKDRQENFAAMFGHDIRQSTLTEQLAFVVHELNNGTEKSAGRALQGATSAYDAGALASRRYVRPGVTEDEKTLRASQRASMAAALAGVQGATTSIASAGSSAGRGSSTSNDNRTTVTTGDIIVHTRATDAYGIARDIRKSMDFLFTSQANAGLF